jgi:hypothetical protein
MPPPISSQGASRVSEYIPGDHVSMRRQRRSPEQKSLDNRLLKIKDAQAQLETLRLEFFSRDAKPESKKKYT